MKKLDFSELTKDYESQLSNLNKYNSIISINSLLNMKLEDRYFFDVNTVANVYNMTSDNCKESLLKVIYYLLIQKYYGLMFNSDLTSITYCEDDNVYNMCSYFCKENPTLAFELKHNENKVELVFYDDLMETKKSLDINKQIARLHEQLYRDYKAIKNVPIQNMYIGGGPNYFSQISDCEYELNKEYKNIYTTRETYGFWSRKSLMQIYFNTLECLTDFYNIDRTNIKDGDKIIVKEYPFMDISVVFTNKRDIKEIESSKVLVKK